MKHFLPDISEPKSDSIGPFGADIIDAIADWCDALHRGISFQDTFARLVHALGAEAGMIVRTRLNEFRPMRVVIHDSKTSGCQALTTSFADEYFGRHLITPRSATIWLGSVHADEKSARSANMLPEWQTARRMKEFAVLVLAGGPTTRDHIELHFREDLSADVRASLAAVVPTMARTWATRQVGLISSEAVAKRLSRDCERSQTATQPILGIANPTRLSRAEFRVCLLLSRGLSIAGVSAELALTDATVRSHLRSIYAKTETSGLAELVFHLIKPTGSTADYEIKCA